jgi:hypothetical protein
MGGLQWINGKRHPDQEGDMTEVKPLITWPKELTKEQEKDHEEHDREMHFDTLWDDVSITEDPMALAVYIRAGGDIDDQKTRELIASLLDKVPYKRTRTRPFAHDSMETYLAVEMLCRVLKLSLPKAIVQYSEKHELSDETVKSRYKTGKKWITDAHSRKKDEGKVLAPP